MTRIFISYRRDDLTAFPGRIYDRLVAHFGRQIGLGIVLHYSGGRWASAPLPRQENELWGIAMASPPAGSPDAGWIAGNCGTILHYDGSQWQDWGDPSVFGYLNLRTVAVVSATEAWAGGGNDTEAGLFVHFVESPDGKSGTDTRVTANTNGKPFAVESIAMVSATSGWAVGATGVLLHYDGSAWTALASSPTTQALHSIAMLPSGAVGWAVGDQGTILQDTGGTWRQVTTAPTSSDLNGIALASASEAWAVGANGTILRYNGG